MEKSKISRLFYIDALNILACFYVVCLHCSGAVFNFESSPKWYIALAIQTLTHCAVPVFVMITGATLLEYRERYTTKTFLKKRMARTLIPFLIWSVIYVVWNSVTAGNGFPEFDAIMSGLLSCKATNIFWFFYMIFGIYLSIPILSLIAKKENEKLIYYYAALCILVNALIPLYNYFSAYPLSGNFSISIASGYIGFLLFGYIIKNESWSKKIRLAVYFAGALGILLMFFGTVFISKRAGKLDKLFLDYNSLPCMAMSVSCMLFIKHINWEKIVSKASFLKKLLPTVSGASLGIYLIHLIVMKYFKCIPFVDSARIRYMFYAPFAVYGISLIIVLLIKKIPLLKKIFP